MINNHTSFSIGDKVTVFRDQPNDSFKGRVTQLAIGRKHDFVRVMNEPECDEKWHDWFPVESKCVRVVKR